MENNKLLKNPMFWMFILAISLGFAYAMYGITNNVCTPLTILLGCS